MRDPISGQSKGFGFIHYDNFESSDKAIEEMDGKYFSNQIIKVEYAYKQNTKGEKHGTFAERFIAANRPVSNGLTFGNFNANYLEEGELVIPKNSKIPKNFQKNI